MSQDKEGRITPLEDSYCEEWDEPQTLCLKGYPPKCPHCEMCKQLELKEFKKAERAESEYYYHNINNPN